MQMLHFLYRTVYLRDVLSVQSHLIWCLITGSVDGVEIDQYNVAHGRQRVRRQSSLMLLEYLLADDAALIIDTMP